MLYERVSDQILRFEAPRMRQQRGCAHRLEARSHTEGLLLSWPDEGEDGPLRVEADNDPEVIGYLMGTHEQLAVLLLDACCRSVDIFDVEVVKPERDWRLAGVPRHHAAYPRAAVIENPVSAIRSHVHRAVFVPTEEAGVEGPCGSFIVGRELIPADGAR